MSNPPTSNRQSLYDVNIDGADHTVMALSNTHAKQLAQTLHGISHSRLSSRRSNDQTPLQLRA